MATAAQKAARDNIQKEGRSRKKIKKAHTGKKWGTGIREAYKK